MSGTRSVLIAAVAVIAAAAGYRWWTSDERAIKARLDGIAAALTIPANEAGLARVTRVAVLRNSLAPAIEISGSVAPAAGGEAPQRIVGRDAVLALAGRWSPPPGGMDVEIVDVHVTIEEGGASAIVNGTAKITAGTSEPTVDAREVSIGLSKIDGEWLVTSARPEETLRR